MKVLNRRPRIALLLSALIAVGTVVAIAASDRPQALWDTLAHTRPLWLLGALAAEFAAYLGYGIAYRSTILAQGAPRLSVLLTLQLVVAGFGAFVPMGGFAFDRTALRAASPHNRRSARIQVLGLGVIEYLTLAPAACVCALVLFLGSRASPAITLPWILAVPPGLLLGWWSTRPPILAYLARSGGRLRRRLGDLLTGVEILRGVVLRPLERPWALLGMAVYWAAELACLGLALRCFGAELSVPALVVAYATGYAASRRTLPFGGAGITEALLTISLIAVHVQPARALFAVVAYRLINFVAPTLPALLAHSSLTALLQAQTKADTEQARVTEQPAHPSPPTDPSEPKTI